MKWDDAAFMTFDYETSGKEPEYALQPWRIPRDEAWATSLVWSWKAGDNIEIGGDILDTSHDPEYDLRFKRARDMSAAMLEKAINEQRRIIGWNTVFDLSVLFAYGLDELIYKCKWLDAMLLWKHYFMEPEYEAKPGKRKSYGLKKFVEENLSQFAGYEEDIDFHDPHPETRKKLHAYNVRDNIFTLKGANYFWTRLSDRQLRCALIEASSLPLLARANLNGMPVDTLSCRELSQHLFDVSDEKLTMLAPLGVDEATLRSPIKLARVLFDDWKLPVLKENKSKLTGKTSRSTDKEVLHELAFQDPRARTLRDAREALNNRTKFAETILDSVEYNGDGCTHPLVIPFGTYSGRMTYSSKQGSGVKACPIGFAIHQMKGRKDGPKYRASLKAPEGYAILEFDASGQEYRWMAIASMDPVMLQMCQPGEDPHSYMGARIAEKDYRLLVAQQNDPIAEIKEAAEMDRKLGKVANLSLQYRTSARKLRTVARVDYLIPMEMPQAQLIHRTYPKTYTEVPIYWRTQIEDTKKLGYVETFAGRRVQVKGNWGGEFGWSMGSTAINYRIQGTGADQKQLALAIIKNYIVSIGAYFAWDLHDGIYLFVPEAKLQEAASTIKRLLDNLPYKQAWGFTPPIPLPWDCKAGGSWGTLKGYEP